MGKSKDGTKLYLKCASKKQRKSHVQTVDEQVVFRSDICTPVAHTEEASARTVVRRMAVSINIGHEVMFLLTL